MKLIKFGLVATVATFVILSFKHVTNIIDKENARDNSGVALYYTFASLTLGFAGVSALFNLLDMASVTSGNVTDVSSN